MKTPIRGVSSTRKKATILVLFAALVTAANQAAIVGVSKPPSSDDSDCLPTRDRAYDVSAPPYPLNVTLGIGNLLNPEYPDTYGTFVIHDHQYVKPNAPDPARSLVTYWFSAPAVVAGLEIVQHVNGVTSVEGLVGDDLSALSSIGTVMGPRGDVVGRDRFEEFERNEFWFTNVTPGLVFQFVIRKTSLEDGFALYRAYPLDPAGDRIPPVGRDFIVEPEPSFLSENTGEAGIRVIRLLSPDQPASIGFGVSAGTASLGADFVLPSGVLEFAPGVTNLPIPLTIVDDVMVEGPEYFILSLTNALDGQIRAFTFNIIDDDTGIEFEQAAWTAAEESGSLVLGVRRQDDSTEPATAEFTTMDGTARAGEDFTTVSGTLTFASGEAHKEIVVALVDDGIREADERFTVRLSNVTGGSALGKASEATVTIPMNDLATLHVWQDSPNPTPPYLGWATAAHTIQEAVDAALPSETVRVTNGVYDVGARVDTNDSWTVPIGNRVYVTNPIKLESVNGPALTAIAGAHLRNEYQEITNAVRCVFLGTNAVLSGFTLTNGHAAWSRGGGAYATSRDAIVTNCVLIGNSAHDGGGAYGCTLYDCVLANNVARWWF